jgi:hypothetical protein
MPIKLLLLAAIAYFVWRIWHRFIRVPQPPRQGGARRGPGRNAAMSIDDMTKCPACQTYVASGSPGCGRQDCPRRG